MIKVVNTCLLCISTAVPVVVLVAIVDVTVTVDVVMLEQKEVLPLQATSYYHRFEKGGKGVRTVTCQAIASATATANTVK